MSVENLNLEKKKANEIFRRALMLEGHTAGKNFFMEATKSYADILQKVEVSLEQDPTNNEFLKLKLSILLNLSACSLKLKSIESCLNCCNEVLKMDSLNEKAFFRKASILMVAERFQESESVLEILLQHFPKNKAALKLIKSCRTILNKKKDLIDEIEKKNIDLDDLSEVFGNDLIRNGSFENIDCIAWNQSLQNVQIIYFHPLISTKVNVSVEMDQESISIASNDGTSHTFLLPKKEFFAVIDAEESTWQFEYIKSRRVIVFSLVKKRNFDAKQENELSWWPKLFKDQNVLVDISKCKLKDHELNQLPENLKAQWKKNVITNEKTLGNEEVALMQEKEKLEQNRLNAKKDPNKKQFLEMMEKNFPNVPVDIK